MANRLVRVPEVVYTPPVPPVPPTPGYCETTTVGQWGWVQHGNGRYTYIGKDANTGEDIWWYVGNWWYEWEYYEEEVETCYPGTPGRPGVPPKVETRNLSGWNGGASSYGTLTPPGYVEATFPPRASGTALGLIVEPVRFRSLAAQEFAVMAKGNYVSALRRGITEWDLYQPAYRRYRLLVDGGRRVHLYGTVDLKKPTFVHLYTFKDSLLDEAATVYADGLVYTVADYLDDPAINQYLAAAAELSLDARLWRASDHRWFVDSISISGVPLVDGRRYAGSVFQLGVTVEASTAVWHRTVTELVCRIGLEAGRVGVFTAQSLPALLGMGAYKLRASVSAGVPPVSLRAHMGPVMDNQPAGLYALVPPFTLFGLGRDVNTSRLDSRLPMLLCRGFPTQTVAEGSCVISPVLELVSRPIRSSELQLQMVVAAFDAMQLTTPQLFVVMDGLEVNATASLVVVMDVEALDGVLLEEGRGIEYLVELLARERVYVNSDAASAQREALQYAVSLAGGALSVYRGFDFQGFACTAEDTYGWRRDGIYRIGGATDDGELIDALVDFGTTDYGDAHLKRISAAYLGLRSDGEVYLRVRADDGRERRYRVAAAHNEKRAVLSKGMAGRYWSLALEIEQGSFADLDNMELEVGVSQRRLTGRRR